jgi:perosamine synthetase
MPAGEFIPVSKPTIGPHERQYVDDCVESTWISSIGTYITRFEEAVASAAGTRYAISCCNGTVALHLALLGLGIGPGDEVLVPSLTYVASANAVRYCGAEPVFVDSDASTWNLDPEDVARKRTRRTKAIMAVHLYGRPAAMAPLRELADSWGVPLIEDAAEAIGAQYQRQPVGGLSRVGCFSFFGNKIVTCGEGGAVVTNDRELADRIRQLKGQGQDPTRRYWFPVVGYNYRLTNIHAAIGLAQLEQLASFIEQRDRIAAQYRDALATVEGVQLPACDDGDTRSVCWLFSVVLRREDVDRDRVIAEMHRLGIETRPFFYPCHSLPPYERASQPCPRATWLAARGISLPTWIGMDAGHVQRVRDALCHSLDATRG